MKLYVANEKYDGYIRDNCLWREEIDIFDKMAVQIKYMNKVQVSYSLTTYSPFEGFRLAFNGKNGRLETHEGIPWRDKIQEDQSKLHDKEMDHSTHSKAELKYHEIVSQRNFEDYKRIEFPFVRKGHWGGDNLMFDEIFREKMPKCFTAGFPVMFKGFVDHFYPAITIEERNAFISQMISNLIINLSQNDKEKLLRELI